MAEYQKVLQIFRSDNIWLTKNIAKAEIERHARALHPEQGLRQDLRDGEEIAARYYDKINGATYQYVSFNGNPYDASQNSANHVWVNGFDSFATMPDSDTVSYGSAAYIRVGEGTVEKPWVYYKLEINNATHTLDDSNGISTVIGMVYSNYTEGSNSYDLYIEWFDSAADAQTAIKGLNYTDVDLEKGFVSAVHQKSGKVISLHGDITSEKAITVDDNGYAYEWLSSGSVMPSVIPSDWVWDSSSEGNAFPEEINVNSPKYYHITAIGNEGFYELRKNINVGLNIKEGDNILAQGIIQNFAWNDDSTIDPTEQTWVSGVNSFDSESVVPTPTINSPRVIRYGTENNWTYKRLTITNTVNTNTGLSTNLTLRALDPTEVNSLGANVKEAFKLVGTATGTEQPLGDIIKIYKDSSLHEVYLGHVDDEINPSTGEVTKHGTGADALCFIYQLADGTFELVAVNIESFLSENEFKDGLELKGGTLRYTNTEVSLIPVGYDWVNEGTGRNDFDTKEAAEAVTATASSPLYLRYKTSSTEPVTYGYFRKESGKEVYVKLATDGGIDFKDEGAGINKSLKIKIDTDNAYYRPVKDGETATHGKGSFFSWGNGITTYYTTTKDNGDTTVYTTTDGITFTIVEGGGTISNGKLTVNETVYTLKDGTTTGYYANNNGGYISDQYLYTTNKGLAVDLDVLENTIVDKSTNDLLVNGEGYVKGTDGKYLATVTANDILVAGNESTKNASTMVKVKEVETVPEEKVTGYDFIECHGVIYEWSGSAYVLYEINENTNLNEAIAILNHQAYYIDMGTFSITSDTDNNSES